MLPTGPFSIIYADPPWAYRAWSGNSRYGTADSHYPVMRPEEISALPVADIAAQNAALFLWVTFPCLEQGLQLIRDWGFRYKTQAFTWVKQNRSGVGHFWGLGHYTRANAEVCLLATRGRGLPRLDARVHSVIETPIGRHSEKPAEARERIVRLFGDLPRIELFARASSPGWTVWGNGI